MGWDFCEVWKKKADVVAEITRNADKFHVVGQTVWFVQGINGENTIVCALVRKEKVSGWWGYKDMIEAEGPCYYDCPLAFLDLAPVKNTEWRQKVIAFHKHRQDNKT